MIELFFTWERQTKNCHRYREEGPKAEQTVGQLYVQKRVYPDPPPPQRIRVTIEPIREEVSG